MPVTHVLQCKVSQTQVIHLDRAMTLKELAELALKYDKRVRHTRDKLELRPTLVSAHDTTRPGPIRYLSGDATTN